jgi:hypothetical protein
MPKNIRVNDQQSRSLQLSWTQPYAGNSAITNYIIQYKLVSGMVCFIILIIRLKSLQHTFKKGKMLNIMDCIYRKRNFPVVFLLPTMHKDMKFTLYCSWYVR